MLKHTLRRSRFILMSLWVVFSLSTLLFQTYLLTVFCFSMLMPTSMHAQIKKKLSKNDYHFPLREDKPSLSSLISHSSQLSPSRHAFALLFLNETSTQHARKYYPWENRYVPKITLEGLRWVEGLYGGFILLAPFGNTCKIAWESSHK